MIEARKKGACGKRETRALRRGSLSACAILNAHHITKRELYLVRNPLQVLQTFEGRIDGVVPFLSDGSFLVRRQII
jgi:hypothetical protein